MPNNRPGWGALLPRFNIPETFGTALSYEGQLHWFLQNWDEVAEYANALEQPTIDVVRVNVLDSNAAVPDVRNIGNDINASLEFDLPRIYTRFADPYEWDFEKSYDVLTVVGDGEGNSYTSRQAVPKHIALTDTDYWVRTGSYDASLEHLTGRLDDVELGYARVYKTVADMQRDDWITAGMICRTLGFHAAGDGGAAWYVIGVGGTVNGYDTLSLAVAGTASLTLTDGYMSPEMVGAYGDGVHDDTAAVAYAIGHYAHIKASGNYAITETLDIIASGRVYEFSGTINCSGEAAAVAISGGNSRFVFNRVVSANGDGIELAKSASLTGCIIEFQNIIAENNGITFTNGNHHCHYNSFRGGYIAASEHGVHVDINSGWFNSNYFDDITFIGNSEYAIYLNSTGDVINCNNFTNYSTENCVRGAYLNSCNLNTFSHFRGYDNAVSKTEFSINGNSTKNSIYADNFIYLSNIENNCTAQMANNVLIGQIAYNSATPILNKVLISAPVTYVDNAYGFMPIEYSAASKQPLWISTDTVISPMTTPWQMREYIYVQSDGLTITLPQEQYNGRCVNEVTLISSAPRTINLVYNGASHQVTTPLKLILTVNASGSTKDAFVIGGA